MANEDEKLIIEVELDDGKLAKGFVSTDKIAKTSGKKAGKDFGESAYNASKNSLLNLKNLVLGVGTALAGAFAARRVVQAAQIQENAVNEINTALQLSGQYSRQASEDFQAYASTLQASSRIGDEVILQNAALIQNLGKLETEALKPATKAALDMAEALNIDLRAAATLVGKAAAGEVSSFSRYGVIIEKGATQAETFSNALVALEKQFGGAAAAKLRTYDGSVTQLSNTFGDLLESVGRYITKSPVVIATFKVISEQISEVIKGLDSFRDSSGAPEQFTKSVISLGVAINEYIVKPFETAFGVARVFFNAIDSMIATTTAILGNIGGRIATILKFTGVRNDFTSLLDDLARDSESYALRVNKAFTESINNIGSTGLSEGAQAFINQVAQMTEQIEKQTQRSAAGIKNSISTAVAETKKGASQIQAIVQNGLVRGIASGIETVGAALVKGGEAFNGFGNAVISLIGDLAIQIGTAILATGQAIEALRASVISMFGGQAIAAGIALIALGGALKAYSSQAGTSVSSASVSAQTGGDSYGTQLGESSAIEEEDPEIERRADTQIVVNVQGNIMDSDESGLRIVDLINKSIKEQGAVLA